MICLRKCKLNKGYFIFIWIDILVVMVVIFCWWFHFYICLFEVGDYILVLHLVVEKDEYPCLLLTRFTTDSIQRKAVKAFIPNTSVIVNWLVSSFWVQHFSGGRSGVKSHQNKRQGTNPFTKTQISVFPTECHTLTLVGRIWF